MIRSLAARHRDVRALRTRIAEMDAPRRVFYEIGLARDYEGSSWLPMAFVDRWVRETREAMLVEIEGYESDAEFAKQYERAREVLH